jgi:hypothetical protein
MGVKDLFGFLIACAVLTVQLVAALPWSTPGPWYWPFMDYPMYSFPALAGDTASFHALDVNDCTLSSWRQVDAQELGIRPYRYRGMLRAAAQDDGESASHNRQLLETLVRRSFPEACGARLVQLDIPLEIPEEGWDRENWLPLEEWPLR